MLFEVLFMPSVTVQNPVNGCFRGSRTFKGWGGGGGRAPPTVVAVVTDNSYILGLIFLEMGFRFSARRTCNFQGQIRCDNIFPSRTLNCNSKLLTIKIKLAKESFTGLCFSKSFIIQIKSIYPLCTKLNLMFCFPIEDIYRFSNSYEKNEFTF